MAQTVKKKIRRMTDRLIKREKEKEKGTEQWLQKIITVCV